MNYTELSLLEIDLSNEILLGSNPVLVTYNNVILKPTYVWRDEESFPHKVCLRIWQEPSLVPDLLRINNIINPRSLRPGQILFYCKIQDIPQTRQIIPSNSISSIGSNSIQFSKSPNSPNSTLPTISVTEALTRSKKGIKLEGNKIILN
jgi:hypothetical protein